MTNDMQGTGSGRESAQLVRPEAGRVLGGVAAGLANHFGIDVAVVRVIFAVLVLLGGTGVPLYVAAWLIIPDEVTRHSVLSELLGPQPL